MMPRGLLVVTQCQIIVSHCFIIHEQKCDHLGMHNNLGPKQLGILLQCKWMWVHCLEVRLPHFHLASSSVGTLDYGMTSLICK